MKAITEKTEKMQIKKMTINGRVFENNSCKGVSVRVVSKDFHYCNVREAGKDNNEITINEINLFEFFNQASEFHVDDNGMTIETEHYRIFVPVVAEEE